MTDTTAPTPDPQQPAAATGAQPYAPPPQYVAPQPYAPPQSYAGQDAYVGQAPYAGQDAYVGQAPYAGQGAYVGQDAYTGQQPYAGPPSYAAQPYAQQQPYGAPAAHAQGADPALVNATYQPTPTAPAPYALAPYSMNGPAYVYTSRTNPLALASMIVSIVSLFLWVIGIGGVIMGHIALKQIARTGEGGRGMALAGVIIGYASIGFMVLYVGFIALAVIAGSMSG